MGVDGVTIRGMKKPLFALLLLMLSTSCQEPVLSTNTPGKDMTQESPPPTTGATPLPQNNLVLQGVIQEAGTQRLLPGVTVRINTTSQVSDEAGFFRFENLAPGEVKLIATAPNYVPINRTLELTAGTQTEDLMLQPVTASSPSPTPEASPTPIILLPDGSTATPEPTPMPTATATPTPSATPTPEATPTTEPSASSTLNEATQASVLVQRKNEDLLLTFTLNKSNGAPVQWSGDQVFIEYYIATPGDEILTSGKSLITSNGDRFVVSLGGRPSTEMVKVDITLLLPNQQVLTIQDLVNVQG